MAAIEDHLPHLTAVVVHGPRERRLKLLERPADLYVINHDGVAVVLDALAQRADIDLVVIDEVAQVARNAKTRRWTTLNAVVNHKTHKRTTWGMTGTPTPNAPTDAYGQAKLITPGTTPPYFTRFRDQVMRQAGLFAWVPREDATERVHALLQPAIRFSRDECVDLPPTTYTSRHVPLTREQQTAYDKMKRLLVAEAAQGQILAVNEGVKISKLVQIACGAAYAVDGSTVAFNATPRLTETVELIREAAGKTLVFVPFISALHMVAAALEREGITVGAIYGETNRSERDVLFASFQRQAEPQVLVCQPAAMSHGLTLTQASTIIWYAPITSAEIFEQANGRITRPGQRHNTLIVQIEGSDVERRIYKRLREKQHMQGLLLDMVRDGRE
jgi:SNF2 family DNA or RNA helicase